MRRTLSHKLVSLFVVAAASVSQLGCSGDEPEGLAPATPADVTVKMDFDHKPLPEIPLPTDLAMRYDETSATNLRINASMVKPTQMERTIFGLLDQMDGWGVLAPVTVPFSSEIDVQSVLDAHRDYSFDQSDDVIYVINITPSSPAYGEAAHLDLGEGHYPIVAEDLDGYWERDPRGDTVSIVFEEHDEDLNKDGILQPEEDTDSDAVLDRPNYLPGAKPAADDLAGRTDALMTFYERETNTLIARPLIPLEERTTYAVVVTRRIKDLNGNPVGSPYAAINHLAQTEKLRPLMGVLSKHGLTTKDIAFTHAFTTGSIISPWIALRDGLYGHGVQAHLATEFPADLEKLETINSKGPNPHTVDSETFVQAAGEVLTQLNGTISGPSLQQQYLDDSQRFIDYHVMGTFKSPQLYQQRAADDSLLPLDEQTWPPDLDRVPAAARAEEITFWLTIPKKEWSVRKDGKPAPIIGISHGYTTNKFEIYGFAGFLARFGYASIAIDHPHHGFDLGALEIGIAKGLLSKYGLDPFADALFKDRAHDQNNDGKKDSGSDFWTAYAFHTRDMLRQSTLDWLQLIRLIRGFDGTREWTFQDGLAGDFDGDGAIDIGGAAEINMFGGSLGGIVGTMVASLEPALESAVLISAGGGLSDGAPRTLQGGVREGFIMRIMAPMYIGEPDPGSPGSVDVQAVMPDLNRDAHVKVGEMTDVQPGDTIVLSNLSNGEVDCAIVDKDGAFRVGVASNIADRHAIQLFTGLVLTAQEKCELSAGAASKLKSTFSEFGRNVSFQYWDYTEGEPLRALAEGLGEKRATPAIRRLLGLGQHVLDPGDPAVLAQYLGRRELTYPGTGETVETNAIVWNTVGDMGVPVAMGMTIARCAGFVDYLNPDPRYAGTKHAGMTPSQILIDTYMVEGVDTLKRFTDSNGRGILFDVDDLDDQLDEHVDTPHLSTPLRLVGPHRNGVSGLLNAYIEDTGIHGGVLPGQKPDKFTNNCKKACTLPGDNDPCACAAVDHYDFGVYTLNFMGHFFQSRGTSVSFDQCNERDDCPGVPPLAAPTTP